ncbi:hypothetical protein KXD40_008558 [Peronospora effusa]|uniref:Uncharacterized protein n=1 Tax=Peronospora effusa TaxID=542832 RepID=A0A425CL88_9STRA|nr:hypothetical protein DD237_001640 [Peronospora effusa]UIZ24579.1 hypothetical protein KXD40_008558 [Peronospora effusa]
MAKTTEASATTLQSLHGSATSLSESALISLSSHVSHFYNDPLNLAHAMSSDCRLIVPQANA